MNVAQESIDVDGGGDDPFALVDGPNSLEIAVGRVTLDGRTDHPEDWRIPLKRDTETQNHLEEE